jgi:hypothetical protein
MKNDLPKYHTRNWYKGPAKLFWAMFKRWAYLLFIGMWKGECAYTVWQRGRIKILGSGKPIHGIPGVFKNYKIWYG